MDPSKLKGVLGFLRPKPAQEVNVGRRAILGLPRQADEMLPSVVTSEQPPVVGALQKVIEDKMAKPTSRREFMGEGVKAAASTAARSVAPGALKQMVKKVTEVPTIGPATDEAIAKAISDVVRSEVKIPESVLEDLHIEGFFEPEMGHITDDFSNFVQVLQDAAQRANDPALQRLSETLGLTPAQIAKKTGLPEDVVSQYIGDPNEVLRALIEHTPRYEYLHPADVYEGTPLESIFSRRADPLIREALDKYGPDAEFETVLDHLHSGVRGDFTRAHGDLGKGKENLSRSMQSAMQETHGSELDELLRHAFDTKELQGIVRDLMKGE